MRMLVNGLHGPDAHSDNCSFFPTRTYHIYHKERQQNLTSEQLEPVSVWHFCLKSGWKRIAAESRAESHAVSAQHTTPSILRPLVWKRIKPQTPSTHQWEQKKMLNHPPFTPQTRVQLVCPNTALKPVWLSVNLTTRHVPVSNCLHKMYEWDTRQAVTKIFAHSCKHCNTYIV